MNSNRILIVCVSLVLVYFAVWAGDGMSSSAPSGIIAVVVLLGLLTFLLALHHLWEPIPTSAESLNIAATSAVTLICAALLFGLAATPITLGVWWSPWLFLLFVGCIPTIFAIKDIVLDVLE